MRLVRIIRNGQTAFVYNRQGKTFFVHRVKFVIKRMTNYFVRILTGILDRDGSRINIVLERIRSVGEYLRELAKAILPPEFGFRVRYRNKFEICLVWRQ